MVESEPVDPKNVRDLTQVGLDEGSLEWASYGVTRVAKLDDGRRVAEVQPGKGFIVFSEATWLHFEQHIKGGDLDLENLPDKWQ